MSGENPGELDVLSQINAPQTPPPSDPDQLTRRESQEVELDRAKAKLEAERHELETKKVIVKSILPLYSIWLTVLLILLIWEGVTPWAVPWDGQFQFHLSDTIWVTLLGGTTASIIGVLTAIVKSVYHNN